MEGGSFKPDKIQKDLGKYCTVIEKVGSHSNNGRKFLQSCHTVGANVWVRDICYDR